MYGLIGYPLGHSYSAEFFNNKFEKEHIDECYRLFPIPSVEDVDRILAENPSLEGFNVTIPYKEQIMPRLDSLSEEAREIGAVNVVKILREGDRIRLEGHNSDAAGFRESIKPLLRNDMKAALVLGTGGASKAVAYVLRGFGMEVTKVSRHKSSGTLSYDDLTAETMSRNLVIVNTTPLGMWPETDRRPDIPYGLLTPRHLCFDLIYNPEVTTFMRLAAEHGATTKNGLEMLKLQALAAWEIWRRGK